MEAHVIHAVKEIVTYFKTIPDSTWYTLGVVLASSAVVSGVLQAVKHFGLVTEKKAVIATLTGLSVVASFLGNFIQYGTSNNHFLGDYTLQIVGVATVIYHFFTSPLYKKVVDYVAKAEGLNKELAPSSTTPPVSEPTPTDTLV